MILLKHASGDAKTTSVQENAAVALGKLCTAEPRYHGVDYAPWAPSSLCDIFLKKPTKAPGLETLTQHLLARELTPSPETCGKDGRPGSTNPGKAEACPQSNAETMYI